MDSRELFARLRDQLALLYGTEADARIVVADAGLDAATITFSTNARANWHAILQAAVKTEQVATLLLVVSKEYGGNHDFQALYQAYRTFVTAGGRLTASAQPNTETGGISAGGDVIIATVGDGAQHVVIGKEIYLGSGSAPAALTRATELAYLNALLKDYQYWAEKYTPLAGIAEVRAATVAGLRLDLPQLFMPTGFEKLIEHGFGEQRRTERVAVDDLRTAVDRYRRLVLLGEPGSGKTTTLWRLVHDYAQAATADETAPLPVLVALGGYTGSEPLLDYCQTSSDALGTHLLTCLRQGRVILLLDGLNEMPRRDYNVRVQHIQQLLNTNPDLSVVVTCRALDYVETLALEKLEVKALEPERQLAYLQRYLGESAGEKLFWQLTGTDVAALWQSWQQAGGDWATFWTAERMPVTVEQKISWVQYELWARLRQGPLPALLALGSNPYMLVMLAQVYAAQQALPQNRGRLFAAFVSTLLAREEKRADPAQWPGAAILCTGLAQLAYSMQRAGERGTAIDEAWAIAQITVNGCSPQDLLYLATSATLLDWRSGTVRFVHQLVQEYFAALVLQNAWTAGANLESYWLQGWSKPSGWEETLILMAGLLPDMSDLLDALRTVNPTLAARCAVESGGPPLATVTTQRLQTTLVTIATGRRTPLTQRNAAADALNYLGDPRPGVGLTASGLPDLTWCAVPAGPFLFGNTKATDEMADDDESRRQRLHLPAFAISQYPITNWQFEPFVRDGGYTTWQQRYWTAVGWQWRVEHEISGPASYGDPYALPNHPVVGVSWYEAVAYCNWLSAQVGRPVRLPSEAEWEKAARGTDGRRYPWGNELTPEHANYDLTDINTTSAVGIFPKGVSPYGLYDLAGNVWEWTSSLYKNYPYKADDGREDPAADGGRVMRGGSFNDDRGGVYYAYRRGDPDLRYDGGGFRVISPGS